MVNYFKPAVSDEAWKEAMQEPASAAEPEAQQADVNALLDGRCMAITLNLADGEHARIPPECYHAAAAFALFGQPFGFTWADVDLLERRAQRIGLQADEEGKRGGEPGDVLVEQLRQESRQMLSMSRRIAALLPPREMIRGTGAPAVAGTSSSAG
ncbi:hypothetical protein [Longimicrobium terrae]|uniref:Uncharacterized protein n=1 Tax=Longimicrobium terrae TaxID=1639882 RepID=A0A841H3R8_9BACT|nr:hypothetical protein [Longimicrobium terrae]MBB4638601.1 hypothetical protein [Longimicrobium terrae]MBB6072761.1 hypothetical protein [Longimicrobium terrae]